MSLSLVSDCLVGLSWIQHSWELVPYLVISSFFIVAFVGSQLCWLLSLLVPSMLKGKSPDAAVLGASCWQMHI